MKKLMIGIVSLMITLLPCETSFLLLACEPLRRQHLTQLRIDIPLERLWYKYVAHLRRG